MWCAYASALLAFVSLPDAIRGGTSPTITWIAQTFSSSCCCRSSSWARTCRAPQLMRGGGHLRGRRRGPTHRPGDPKAHGSAGPRNRKDHVGHLAAATDLIDDTHHHAESERALPAILDRWTLEVDGGRIATSVGKPVPHIRPLPGVVVVDRITMGGAADLHYLTGAQRTHLLGGLTGLFVVPLPRKSRPPQLERTVKETGADGAAVGALETGAGVVVVVTSVRTRWMSNLCVRRSASFELDLAPPFRPMVATAPTAATTRRTTTVVKARARFRDRRAGAFSPTAPAGTSRLPGRRGCGHRLLSRTSASCPLRTRPSRMPRSDRRRRPACPLQGVIRASTGRTWRRVERATPFPGHSRPSRTRNPIPSASEKS